MKYPITWYLIADGTRARILSRPKPTAKFEVIFAEDASASHLRSGGLVTDRPGHVQESSNSSRHAIEPRHDARQIEQDRFLRTVVEHVNRQGEHKSFDRLMIYAAPRTLGFLRAGLNEAVRRKLAGAHAKDLTKVPLADLPAHLGSE